MKGLIVYMEIIDFNATELTNFYGLCDKKHA